MAIGEAAIRASADLRRFTKALNRLEADLRRFNKQTDIYDRKARRTERQANRRPALIHNGGKP